MAKTLKPGFLATAGSTSAGRVCSRISNAGFVVPRHPCIRFAVLFAGLHLLHD